METKDKVQKLNDLLAKLPKDVSAAVTEMSKKDDWDTLEEVNQNIRELEEISRDVLFIFILLLSLRGKAAISELSTAMGDKADELCKFDNKLVEMFDGFAFKTGLNVGLNVIVAELEKRIPAEKIDKVVAALERFIG